MQLDQQFLVELVFQEHLMTLFMGLILMHLDKYFQEEQIFHCYLEEEEALILQEFLMELTHSLEEQTIIHQ